MRRTAEDVVEIGKALLRQQAKLPHGMFLPWIETEFDMGQSTAYNFMGVAKKFGDKLTTLASLPPTALYELQSSTAEVQAEVERRIAAGELVSGADVRTLKAEFAEVAAKARELGRETEAVREQNRDAASRPGRRPRPAHQHHARHPA